MGQQGENLWNSSAGRTITKHQCLYLQQEPVASDIKAFWVVMPGSFHPGSLHSLGCHCSYGSTAPGDVMAHSTDTASVVLYVLSQTALLQGKQEDSTLGHSTHSTACVVSVLQHYPKGHRGTGGSGGLITFGVTQGILWRAEF